MCTYLRDTKCSAPPYAHVHKADGGGLWRMRLEPPFSGLYQDINQLLASDKIGCSGSECFLKPGWGFSYLSKLSAIGIFTYFVKQEANKFYAFKNNNFAQKTCYNGKFIETCSVVYIMYYRNNSYKRQYIASYIVWKMIYIAQENEKYIIMSINTFFLIQEMPPLLIRLFLSRYFFFALSMIVITYSASYSAAVMTHQEFAVLTCKFKRVICRS